MQDLNKVIDSILLQETLNTVKLNLLTQMVLSVYKETLPKEQSETIIKNYLNRLETQMNEALTDVGSVLTSDSAPLKAKIEFQQELTNLRNFFE